MCTIDISVYLFGGLGNRLFQMASCYGIARRRGGVPRIAGYVPHGSGSATAHVGLMKRFDPDTPLRAIASRDLQAVATGDGAFREKLEFRFDPEVLDPAAPTTLFGYFQAESYFGEYREDVLRMFRESPAITASLDAMDLPFSESFFVHVRLGDFLRRHRRNHFIDLGSYYRRCLDLLPAHAKLLVFSDEPDKIGEFYPQLTGRGEVVRLADGRTSLHAMARCRLGGICANSSFSWWAGYLNPAPATQIFLPDRFTNSQRCRPDLYFANAREVPVDRAKAFFINLERRRDRWQALQGTVEALGNAVDVRRFSAIEDGRHPHLGCTRSHQAIVAMARQERWPLVLVLEDDVVIDDPAAVVRLLDFLHTRDDWDICFGGVSACRAEPWARLTGRRPTRAMAYRTISDRVMQIPLSLTTVMVAYNHTVYDQVLALDESDKTARIDVYLSENVNRKWVHVPFLARQRPGFSDIVQHDIDSTMGYRRSEQFLLALRRIKGGGPPAP